MHQRYAADGLVCVSVSVDELESQPAALKFLQARRATFANYLLDADAQVWQNKWKVKAPPIVLVYGRDGQLYRKFDNDDPDKPFNYRDDVEPLVRELLGQGR